MKRFTHIEILEEQGFKVADQDIDKVYAYLNKGIELKHDESRIYDESGNYIADLIDCR